MANFLWATPEEMTVEQEVQKAWDTGERDKVIDRALATRMLNLWAEKMDHDL